MAEFSFSLSTYTTISDNALVNVNYNIYWTGTAVSTGFGLIDLTHTFLEDLDFLLVGPGTGRNLLFMSDAGGGNSLVNADFNFSDNWAIQLADNTTLAPGNYLPTNHNTDGTAETSANFGIVDPVNSAGPAGGATFASSFGGMQIAGQWSLAIRDDTGGDAGSLGGFTQTFTTAENFTQINGTGGNDAFGVASSSAESGTFFFLTGIAASFSGLALIIFDGGAGIDSFYGGSVAETVIDSDGLNGETYNANIYGAGFGDTIDYSAITFSGLNPVIINLAGGSASQGLLADTIIGFENVRGSQGAETIYGDANANNIHGNNGADFLNGGSGVDQLYGGSGDDTIEFDAYTNGAVGEILDGGLNTDTLLIGANMIDLRDDTVLSFERLKFQNLTSPASNLVQFNAAQIGPGLSATANIIGSGFGDNQEIIEISMAGQTALNLSGWVITGFTTSYLDYFADHIRITGGSAAETIHASSVNDIVTGGGGADHVFGGGSDDQLYGDSGADEVNGEGGNDALYGGSEADTLNGGTGSDWLVGGTGADGLTGGSSADWFAFDGTISNSGDVVHDYAAGDFLYFGNTSAAPSFSSAAGNVMVNGVLLIGAASGDVTVYTQVNAINILTVASGIIHQMLATGSSMLNAFGTYSRFVFDADNNAAWRVIQDGMTVTNLLDFRWTWNDAGNPIHSIFTDWDQGSANPWTQIVTNYSAAGVADNRWTYNDAGQTHVSTFTDWDQASANTWNYRVNYYSATGVLDVQWTYNDAGQTHVQLFTDWDQASANAWNYRVNYYTAPGVLDYQWTYNDAGNPIHSFNTDWDQTSVATWNYRITYYSAPNVADYQWTYNDAGNPVHSIMHDWDQTSSATWTTRTTYYSALNVADYQWTYHDAGQPYHSTYVDWDQANAQPWAYHVINFSAPGVVANDYYV